MYTHPCLKCGEKYQDSDPDRYYCEPCKAERKAIAEAVDKKFAMMGPQREAKSALKVFEEQAMTKEVGGRSVTFGRA